MNKSRKKLTLILTGAVLMGAVFPALANPDEYYKEPQIFDNRPAAGREISVNGSIGVTGIEIRIYPDVAVTVENTQPGSPAEGKFKEGEIILGVNGVQLAHKNPFIVLGTALTEAEATDGILVFDVKSADGGNTREVALNIPVLGAYSETFPLNCEKSDKIIRQAAEFYAARELEEHNIYNAVAVLFLLSTGRDEYLPRVKEYFSQFLTGDGGVTEIGRMTWNNGYNGIAVAEYYLRTGDETVLPILQHYCDDARDRQKYGKGWGHWGQGLNPRYEGAGGLMHSAGTQVLTTLLLGKECGVDVDEETLLGALEHWYSFVGHGALPVTDTRPWFILRSAGKDGGAAAAMQVAAGAQGDTTIYENAVKYLSKSALTSWPSMRHEWEVNWHGPGGALVLEHDPDLYFKTNQHLKGWYDLSRQPARGFVPANIIVSTPSPVAAGASMALIYTAPLKNLRITGAPRSEYAKDFELPARLWGNQADTAFLSSEHNPEFYEFGEDEDIHITYRQLPIALGSRSRTGLPLDKMLKNVRHWRYVIRLAAAKALRDNNHHEELGKLLSHSDPRLRRAGLDGIIDYRPWCGSLVWGPGALQEDEYTPAMIDGITNILANPEEAWFVVDGALNALHNAPVEVIRKNLPEILAWAENEQWWLRESAFMALMGLHRDDDLFAEALPEIINTYVNEYYANPRINMTTKISEALKQKGTDSRVGMLISDGLKKAVLESKVLPDVGDNRRSVEGAFNIKLAAHAVAEQAPGESSRIAEALIQAGRLEVMPTRNLMRVVKAQDGYVRGRYVGLYPALEKLPHGQREQLSSVLYNDFRPELINRLKAVGEQDKTDLINMIVDLTGLQEDITGWHAIGKPEPAERVWQYRSFASPKEEGLDIRDGRRFRDITLPPDMQNWYSPEFDAGEWDSGTAPIGIGKYKAHGHGRGWTVNPEHYFENNSDWGDGEFLVARTTFDLSEAELEHDYYRISILANQGYHIYLNGHKIHTFIWFQHVPHYRQIMLSEDEARYLRQGTNTLAVYTNVRYERVDVGEYHPIGQIDLSLEGLERSWD